MPAYCAAYNCKSLHSKVAKDISFHKFPLKNPDLLSRWIHAVRRKNWQPTAHSRLCSKHFTQDSFSPRPGARYPLLKDSAVPTIFDYLPHILKTTKQRRTLIRSTPESTLNSDATSANHNQSLLDTVVEQNKDKSSKEKKFTEKDKSMDKEEGSSKVVSACAIDPQVAVLGLVAAPPSTTSTGAKKSASMEFCCVPGCVNNQKKVPSFRLHEFPEDSDYAAKWIRIISLSNMGNFWFPDDGSKVCDEHFLNDDYRTDVRTPTLKPKTLPSVFHNRMKKIGQIVPKVLTNNNPVFITPHYYALSHPYTPLTNFSFMGETMPPQTLPTLKQIRPGLIYKLDGDGINKVSSSGNMCILSRNNPVGLNTEPAILQMMPGGSVITNIKNVNTLPNESNDLFQSGDPSGAESSNMDTSDNNVLLLSKHLLKPKLSIAKDPSLSKAIKIKNQQIRRLNLRINKFTSRMEKLETRFASQERKLHLPSYKKLQSIKKDSLKGDVHANFIMEQIIGYCDKPLFPKWSTTTLNQCIVWRRKASYAYEYLKSIPLFHLPSVKTLKRHLKRNPEIIQQIKDRTISAFIADNSSSSDFEFEEEEEVRENERSQHRFAISQMSRETALMEISKEHAKTVSELIEDLINSVESSSKLEQQGHETTALKESNSPMLVSETSEEILIDPESNTIILPPCSEGEITILKIDGQEVILQPGSIVHLNKDTGTHNITENQYLVMSDTHDPTAQGSDHEYCIIQPASCVNNEKQ